MRIEPGATRFLFVVLLAEASHRPLALLTSIFKTPSLWGIRHTAPYFHDNSAKSLEELAEHYSFVFENFIGITLTKQNEADIVAFLKLL